MSNAVHIRRCAHRKTNGIPCGSPALKDKPYCYFHDRWREQHIDVIDGTPYYQNVITELPILEDANAIQMSLSKVFHMLLAGLLDPKFAKTLIYCLNIAAQNLRYCNFAPKDEDLGDNAPARDDQSIPQNMLKSADRPEGSDYWKMEQDKEDAKLLAKQLAKTEEPKQEETVDIQAMEEEKTCHPERSETMAQPSLHAVEGPSVSRIVARACPERSRRVRIPSVDANVGRARTVSGHYISCTAKNEDFVSGHDFSRAVRAAADVRALAPVESDPFNRVLCD